MSDVPVSDDPSEFDLGMGVGCLWFAAPENQLGDARQHFQRVEEALGSIENITNLTISGADGDFGGTTVLIEDDAEHWYPNVYWVRIKFDIFIPEKVQERLNAKCGAERFGVYIENHYHLPVTYAYASQGSSAFDGSTAIILLRRYLEEKLAEASVKFGTIGPSPFHANFFTICGTEDALIKLQAGPGYTNYVFEYETTSSQGLREFADRYGDVLSLFYELHNLRRRSLRLQSSILSDTSTLIKQPEEAGRLSRIRRLLELGPKHDQISEAIFNDQLCRDHMANLLSEARERDYDQPYNDLESHFRELGRFQRETPYSGALDILKTSELRRQNFLSNTAILIAGLFGGVVGAILGSSLTYVLTTTS